MSGWPKWKNEELARKLANEGFTCRAAADECEEPYDIFRNKASRRGIRFADRIKDVFMKHNIRAQVEGMKPTEAVELLLNFIESNFQSQDVDEIGRLCIKFKFTPQEAAVFAVLSKNTGRILSKEFIFNQLYLNPEQSAEIKIVDVIVCKVRKKLKASNYPDEIKTAWGVGYYHAKADS